MGWAWRSNSTATSSPGLPYNLEDRMTKTQSSFCRGLAAICLALSANAAGAQTLRWDAPINYDKGDQTSVAAHPSGLVLEVHRTSAFLGFGLWYHIGQLNGTGVTWGRSQLSPWEGNWPNVVISKEGYVIFAWTTGDSKSRSDLRYAVGMINPHGGLEQSIDWLTPNSTVFDSGFHSSTAINDNGVILEVHESGSGGSGLYYRVGHLTNPAGGDFTITWDSGTDGVRYDDGINPHIALNNLDEAVEVHQVTGEDLLHYRRGLVYGGNIYFFGGSPRYDDNSSEPAVALLDNGLVIELHRNNHNQTSGRTGILDPDSTDKILWFKSVVISTESAAEKVEYPAVATNGTYAIGSWAVFRNNARIRHLFSAVGLLTSDALFPSELLAPHEVFQSEFLFPARVRALRTVGKAKERSTTPRLTVQSKSMTRGSASLGGTRAKVQEWSPALQKPIQSKSEPRGSAIPGETRTKVKERSAASPKAVQSMSKSPGSASPGGAHGKAKDRRGGRASGP
jgi:hypothetical protein